MTQASLQTFFNSFLSSDSPPCKAAATLVTTHSFAPRRHAQMAMLLPKCNSQKRNISATRIVPACIGTKPAGKTVPIRNLSTM
jgi:hypothetical protein